jgi:hypothetical protein
VFSIGMALSMRNPEFESIMMATGFVGIVVFGVLITTLKDVFRCALYIYATEGVVPAPFKKDDMDSVWKVRKN